MCQWKSFRLQDCISPWNKASTIRYLWSKHIAILGGEGKKKNPKPKQKLHTTQLFQNLFQSGGLHCPGSRSTKEWSPKAQNWAQCPELCWGQAVKLSLSWTSAQLNSLQTGQSQPAKYLVSIPSERALPGVLCCGEVTSSLRPFSRPLGNPISASRFLETTVSPKREHWSHLFRSSCW